MKEKMSRSSEFGYKVEEMLKKEYPGLHVLLAVFEPEEQEGSNIHLCLLSGDGAAAPTHDVLAVSDLFHSETIRRALDQDPEGARSYLTRSLQEKMQSIDTLMRPAEGTTH